MQRPTTNAKAMMPLTIHGSGTVERGLGGVWSCSVALATETPHTTISTSRASHIVKPGAAGGHQQAARVERPDAWWAWHGIVVGTRIA